MKAFVTGATGFIGLNLVEALVNDGWQVTALHRATSNLQYLQRFEVVLRMGDITDLDSLIAAIPEGTDVVFHAAAVVGYWQKTYQRMMQDNVLGTRNVVEAALARKVSKLVHTSSAAVFFNPGSFTNEQTISKAENSPLAYMRSKYLAEEEIRGGIERGLDAVFINPTNVIGRWDTHQWSRLFIMINNGQLPGILPGMVSCCHAAEVTRMHLTAVAKGRCGENYLLNSLTTSQQELIQHICELLDKPVPKMVISPGMGKILAIFYELRSSITNQEPPITRDTLKIFLSGITYSTQKAQQALGYQPRSLESMLIDCAGWLKSEGLLN